MNFVDGSVRTMGRSVGRLSARARKAPTGSESGGRRIVTAPLSFNDFAILRASSPFGWRSGRPAQLVRLLTLETRTPLPAGAVCVDVVGGCWASRVIGRATTAMTAKRLMSGLPC